jgi:hypothetical protein
MAELFGFKFERIKDSKGSEKFTPPTSDDGTIDVAGGGFYSQILDADGRERTESDLIRRYRDISQQPECDSAIEDIVNEGIVSNERDQAVSIVLDRLPYTGGIKKKIREEFDEVLRLLDFDVKGHDIFRRWYVDGRLFYHKVIDKNSPRKGIVDLRFIEPRKIKKGGDNWISNKTYNTLNNYNIHKDKNFKTLHDWISQCVIEYATKLKYKPDFKCVESWFNIYKKNDYQEFHTHSMSSLSAVYFLKSDPKKSSKIYFRVREDNTLSDPIIKVLIVKI